MKTKRTRLRITISATVTHDADAVKKDLIKSLKKDLGYSCFSCGVQGVGEIKTSERVHVKELNP